MKTPNSTFWNWATGFRVASADLEAISFPTRLSNHGRDGFAAHRLAVNGRNGRFHPNPRLAGGERRPRALGFLSFRSRGSEKSPSFYAGRARHANESPVGRRKRSDAFSLPTGATSAHDFRSSGSGVCCFGMIYAAQAPANASADTAPIATIAIARRRPKIPS